MLTPDELEVLRKWDNEAADYAHNVFAHLRRKPHPKVLTPEEIEALTDNETDA